MWNKGNLSLADEICAPDIVCTDPPSTGVVLNGIEELKQYLTAVRTAFDYVFEIDEIIAGDNKVTVQWTFNATHQGEFLGATGKKATNTGIAVITFAGDSKNVCGVRFSELMEPTGSRSTAAASS